MKKRFLKNLLLVCMTTVMLFSCTIGVGAISMEGNSTVGGKPSATTNNAYAISSKDDLAGWRFAVVTTSGTISATKKDKEALCIDIIVNDKESYIASNHYMLDPQYPKIKFVQLYGDTSTQHAPSQTVKKMFSVSTKELATGGRILKESSMGFSAELPDYGDYSNLSSAMNTWQSDETDLGKVLNKFNGFTNGVADLTDSHRVTVEPIYRFSIAGENGKGEWHLMTPTEMAWFSGACYGYNNNGWSGGTLDSDIYNSNGDGTWGFIGNYTHRYWPASLFTENTRSLPWQPVSETEAKNTVDNNRSPRIRLRCYDIIRKGYGVAILYTNTGGSSDDPDPPADTGSKIDLSVEQIQYIQPEASGSGYYRYYYVFLDKTNYPGHKLVIKNPSTGSTAVTSNSSGIPTFSYGAPITVYVQFKNNGKTAISVDGYFTKAGGTQTVIPASPSNPSTYPAANNYTIQPGQTKWFWVAQFNAMQPGESSYTAEVYQNGKKSADGESNTSNNKLTSRYFVNGDLSADIIQYQYVDPVTNKTVSQNVYFGNGTDPYLTLKRVGDGDWQEIEDLPRFPAGVTVTMWVNYRNNQSWPAKIDGYYSLDGGDSTIVGAHPTNGAYPSSDGYALGGNNDKWFWIGSMKVLPGTHSLTASVYYDGKTSSTGETSADNNSMVSEYFVWGDIEVLDIYFTPKGSTTKLSEPVSVEYGTEYDIWVTVKNNTPTSQNIDVWYTHEGETKEKVKANALISATGTANYKVDTRTAGAVADTFTVTAEAYFAGKTSATGECDINGKDKSGNNKRSEDYSTWFYDVAITDIFYEDLDGNVYGMGDNNSTSLLVGETYKVYYTLTNYSSKPATINAYLGKVATAGNKVTNKVLPLYGGGRINALNGISLAANQSITIRVGQIAGANQNIGPALVSGAVYIGDSLNADRETITTNNTLEEQVVFKHNVSIEEVYLTPVGSDQRFPDNTKYTGYVDIPIGTEAQIHYVLKNHTGKTIKVNVYVGSNPKIRTVNNGQLTVTLSPYEVKDVVLDRTATVTSEQRLMMVGSVYRDGYDPKTDPYEMTFDDNITRCYFKGVRTPYLEEIKPNAPYREGTDVITSYYLYNPSAKDYTGLAGATAEVRLTVKVKRTGEVIYEDSKFTVVPTGTVSDPAQQLVYFKWSVPEDYLKDTDKFEISADLVIPMYPGVGISYVSYSQDYITNDAQFTPDTKYEEKEPDGWTKTDKPSVNDVEKRDWYVWSYKNGKFVKNEYGIEINGGYTQILPTSLTSYNGPHGIFMKSGYGVKIGHSTLYSITKSQLLNDMYTLPQYAYMIWPEYGYSQEDGCISTLEPVEGSVGYPWKLYDFLDYGPVHWTPIWFPDGEYAAYACYSDLWTPMGMITVRSTTNKLTIDGNLYDDWYIGHG